MFQHIGYNLPMNYETVVTAVSQSQTKVECLTRLGLPHTNRSFVQLTKFIQKNQIDTSHFEGIPAHIYCRQFRTDIDISELE